MAVGVLVGAEDDGGASGVRNRDDVAHSGGDSVRGTRPGADAWRVRGVSQASANARANGSVNSGASESGKPFFPPSYLRVTFAQSCKYFLRAWVRILLPSFRSAPTMRTD